MEQGCLQSKEDSPSTEEEKLLFPTEVPSSHRPSSVESHLAPKENTHPHSNALASPHDISRQCAATHQYCKAGVSERSQH